MTSTLNPAAALTAAALVVLAAGCTQSMAKCDAAASPTEMTAAPATPDAVNGWREYPLRDGVIKVQPAKWRTDTIDIPVPANGGELEYKLGMKQGDGIVYAISYGALEHAGLMVSEFHGHTEQGADGNGDLMFYSKTGGAAQNGSFQAPWDGIHGWYLKNDSDKDVVVKLEVAGFYDLIAN